MMDLESWAQKEGIKLSVFWKKEVGKKTYDGVEISVSGDIRDFTNDQYVLRAHKEKPTNVFIYERPLAEAVHLDKAVYEKVQDCKHVAQGRSARVTAYKKAVKQTRWRQLSLLCCSFPIT